MAVDEDFERVRTLGDKYNLRLLTMAHQPRTAVDIGKETDIPISTVYSRLNDLAEKGFLTRERRFNSGANKMVSVYRRAVDEIRVVYDEDRMELETTERSPVKDKLENQYRSFAD